MNTSLIGKRIKILRTEKDISQSKLGEVLDVTGSAISDIERGKTELKVGGLITLARFFNVEVSAIITSAQALSQKPQEHLTQFSNRSSRGLTNDENNRAEVLLEKTLELLRNKK